MFPIDSIALARMVTAYATMRTPAAERGAVGGIKYRAAPIRARLVARTAIPLPTFSQDIPDMAWIASERMARLCATIMIPRAVIGAVGGIR
jgi:hypothetical protein